MKKKRSKIILIALAFIIFLTVALVVKNKQNKISTVVDEKATQQKSSLPETDRVISKNYSTSAEEFFGEGGLPENLPKNAKVISQTGDVIIFDSEAYRIMYHDSDKEYALYIFKSPFNAVKAEAEEKFLELLNIKKDEACELDVIIKTTKVSNPNEAGKNYSLSFCE